MGRFPLLVDMADAKILIFGGGSVGERKARLFSEVGANVKVFGTDFTDGLKEMESEETLEGEIELIEEEIKPDGARRLFENAKLVVIATDDKDLNDDLAEAARREGAPINKADDLSTPVMIPSTVKKGDITLSVSTGGKSPAMCKFLRLEIEDWLDKSYSDMVEIQEEMRSKLKEEVDSRERRTEILWSVLKDEKIWEVLREDAHAGRKLAEERVREGIGKWN